MTPSKVTPREQVNDFTDLFSCYLLQHKLFEIH